MRALAIAAIIASLAVSAFTALAVPAFAQDPNKEAQSKAEEQKRKEADEIEKAYKDAVKRTNREQPVKKADPWGNMR
jgi:hypothetical protein